MPTLDDWILEEVVGSGGLAEVWRARPLSGGEAVALKVLREPDRSPAHRERFLREGHLLRRLSHPGLALCRAVHDGPQPYLVLELLDGENLSERLRESGQLPVAQVFRMADVLLRALGYLHDRGITHRDVKSSNIFLSDSDRILLLDLGLATDPTHPLITTLGDVMGTYAYMAPEQIVGAQVDHRSDLYSLGVTLYEALAGVRPYRIKKDDKRAPTEPATPLVDLRPEAPVRLLDVISRLMARDPADRPASAGIARALLTTGEDRRALRPPPLIGRAAAQGAVEAALDASSTVIIHGEVASGTGRMAYFALEQAHERGMETLAIRCRAGAHPLAPLQQIAHDLSEISGPVEATPASLGRALRALAAEGGVLLLIESVEHAAAETVAQLARTLRIARGVSCVITAASPPEGFDGHQIYLRPLRPDETRALLSAMLGSRSPPPDLVAQLHRISGGLPGVIVQGLRELEERGSLQCVGISDDGAMSWQLDQSVSLEPTAALARLFGGTLARLQPDQRRLLEVLSVSGDPLPLPLALELAGASADGAATGALIRQGLADRQLHDGAEWLALRRPAVGALVQRSLPITVRRSMHRALAEAIATQPRSEWREQLSAWHEAHGASPEEAAAALLRLGEDLHRRGQHSRALSVLTRADEALPPPEAVRARLACLRGEVLDAAGRREDAGRALEDARRLAEARGDDQLLGRVLVGLAQVYDRQGLKQRAADLAEEALALLGDRVDDPSLLRALLLAAGYHRLSARREAAAELYNRCIDLAVDQDRRMFAAMGHGGLGGMLAEDGHLEEATLHIEQEAAYARLNQLPARLVPTLCRLAACYNQLGRIDLAIEAISEAEQAARVAEQPYLFARARIARADVHLSVYDLEAAGRLLGDSRLALRTDARADLRLAYRSSVAAYRLAQGDRQAALATFQASAQDAERAGFAVVGAFFQGMIGVLTANPGELLIAMDLLEDTGDRRLSATLLYFGGTVGGDAEVLEFAVEEARASGDRFLLLDVLHAVSGPRAQTDARHLVEEISAHLPTRLRARFHSHPAVRWALSTELTAAPGGPALPPISNYDRKFIPDFELLEDS
jgi:tetratricopeptide (TPR) repeat protein